MNLNEAKNILKKSGYLLIKESRGVTYTPEEIIDDMWYRRFRYFGEDGDFPIATYKDYQTAFMHGFKKDIDITKIEELFANKYDTKEIINLKIAYEEGEAFAKCKTNDEVDTLESDDSADAWFND